MTPTYDPSAKRPTLLVTTVTRTAPERGEDVVWKGRDLANPSSSPGHPDYQWLDRELSEWARLVSEAVSGHRSSCGTFPSKATAFSWALTYLAARDLPKEAATRGIGLEITVRPEQGTVLLRATGLGKVFMSEAYIG